jgi:hypothetical protein
MTLRPSILLFYIVLFGFFARAATYKAPLLDHHAWRQADTASIARNFYRERLNVLYPQIDQRGALETGYVETGLELFAFAVALIAKAAGFRHEIGRVLSALFFVGSCLLTFSFVRRRYGERAALIAAFLYAFAFPLMFFMERAFMNEAMLVFLSLAALTSTSNWLERRRPFDLAVLLVATSLVAAVKLPYLIVWLPIAGLFFERYGSRTAGRWELWAMAASNALAAVLWYTHVHRLASETGLSFGLTDKLFDATLVFSLEFPLRMLERLFGDVLGPIGLIATIVGIYVAVNKRAWCEVGGIAAFVAYVVIVAVGNYHHDYYQLAIMPVVPALATLGILHVTDRQAAAPPGRKDTLLAVVLALAAVTTFARLAKADSWLDYAAHDVELCRRIQMASEPDERIVFVNEGNPRMMFCSDRKGWLLDYATLPKLEEVVAAGARLAVLPRQFDDAKVRSYLTSHGHLVAESPDAEAFRLDYRD